MSTWFTLDMLTNVNLSVNFSRSHISGLGTFKNTFNHTTYDSLIAKSCRSKTNWQRYKWTDNQYDKLKEVELVFQADEEF